MDQNPIAEVHMHLYENPIVWNDGDIGNFAVRMKGNSEDLRLLFIAAIHVDENFREMVISCVNFYNQK